jgi:hypothetical protein
VAAITIRRSRGRQEPDGYNEHDHHESHKCEAPSPSYDSYRFGSKRFMSPFQAFRKPSTSPSFSLLMVIGSPLGSPSHSWARPPPPTPQAEVLLDRAPNVLYCVDHSDKVELVQLEDYGRSIVLDDAVRVSDDRDEDVAQQDDNKERECDVQELLDGEGRVAHLVVDLVHHHGEYL